jgi:pimeloyl-ACP methyl ester carboxylesterase
VARIYRSEDGERAVRARYAEVLKRWPVENEQLRVPTRQGETFVIASGPAGAPPLVLLHGSAFNSAMWLGDVAAWSAHFRVYAVDVIGQAGASAPARPPYASDAYALWLDDVLDALSVERASFVGLSLGAWVALDYAIRRSARAASLVLLCPAGVGRETVSMFTLLFVVAPLLVLGRWGRRRAIAMTLGPVPPSGEAVPPSGEAAPPSSEGARSMEKFSSLVFAHFRPNMARVARFSDADLAALSLPLLLIVGERDAMLDSRETRARIERSVKRAEVRWLPGVGHRIVGQTAPILEFLRRVHAS